MTTIRTAPALTKPTPELLRTAHGLTHRMHENSRFMGSWSTEGRRVRSLLRDLRAERDLIDAEILRRAGDQR